MSTNRHKDYEFESLNTEIYEFEVASGAVRALTSRMGPDVGPAISPDGNLIAYVGFDDKYISYQQRRLYVMNRDGSGIRLLTKNFDRSVGSPRWTPDGKGILCLYTDQGNTKLAVYSLDGKKKVLTGNVGTGARAFHFGLSYTVANNGNLTFPIIRPNIPGEVAVASLENPKAKIITAVNEDLLSHRRLGEVEEVWYTSSLDQRKIQGWIIKPPDFDPQKKYPLILEIHGGPFASYGDRFTSSMQLMAAHGYVVLYTNPRGSTSYGAEFANFIHHAYPGDDFFDLNSGVDMMVKKDYIDPENLFVTGGSGGGILTCWMIGRTDRFRAAVSLYPAINWVSHVLTIDDPLFLKYQFPGFPWEHVEHYEKHSLLSVVNNVKTPTMLITGEKDYRTPLWEAEQYYRALKLLDVETVLIRVPDEPHGASVRPSHYVAKVLNIIGWFDAHKTDKKK
jgi:acylaminoacyl-peptidase